MLYNANLPLSSVTKYMRYGKLKTFKVGRHYMFVSV